MTATAPPPNRRTTLFILAFLALLPVAGAAVSLYFYLDGLARDGTRITLVSPAGAVAVSAGPLDVAPDPGAAAEGVACRHLGTGLEVEQLAFLRWERYVASVEVSATDRPLDLSGLSYTLYDGAGREVGGGLLRLSGTLAPGESREGEIADPRLAGAQRVVIGR
jgi:hypothetical protein